MAEDERKEEEMTDEQERSEEVYARQRECDAQIEDQKGLSRRARMERIRDELARINMAWSVRYHTLARLRGREILKRRAAYAEGLDTDSQNWGMVSYFIEDEQPDFERSLGLDPEAERKLEREVEAAREESGEPRAYDPLHDERFRQPILDYERALAERSFVLLNRLDRDFDNAYSSGEISLTDDVPEYLFWTTPLWGMGIEDDVDGRYVFRDLPPASLMG